MSAQPAISEEHLATPHAAPTPSYFAAPVCRNCGAGMDAAYCGGCGQKRAHKLGVRSLRDEIWQSLRWFEGSVVRSAWQTLWSPGGVAREFVDGARTRNTHPLKLLLTAIGVLVLLLMQVNYLDSANAQVSKVLQVIQSYANWSFSLGIVAIFLASTVAFWRVGGYNRIEHLVLAAYTHFVVIVLSIVNLLPTLLFRSAEFLAAHKQAAAVYKPVLEGVIVALAFAVFFRVHWRRDGWRVVLAAAMFVGAKWALVQAYAWILVKLVMSGKLGAG